MVVSSSRYHRQCFLPGSFAFRARQLASLRCTRWLVYHIVRNLIAGPLPPTFGWTNRVRLMSEPLFIWWLPE